MKRNKDEKEDMRSILAKEWLEDDSLMLLTSWARDGYTLQDVARKIGINYQTLMIWQSKYPEIKQALKNGREIIDYKVENALLKSALGYKTKEVKITTTLIGGVATCNTKEVTSKEITPNVTACQVWLYNRLPNKWKKNRDIIEELSDEDSQIQVTVTRAKQDELGSSNEQHIEEEMEGVESSDLGDEVNQSVTVKKSNEHSKTEGKIFNKKHDSDNGKCIDSKSKEEIEDLDDWSDYVEEQ